VDRALPRMGVEMHAYRILVGNPGGRRPLGRTRRRWENNIIMAPREIGWGGMDYIHLARVGTTCWLS
jgi:hypothetical protein